jgi:hypothetical protein
MEPTPLNVPPRPQPIRASVIRRDIGPWSATRARGAQQARLSETPELAPNNRARTERARRAQQARRRAQQARFCEKKRMSYASVIRRELCRIGKVRGQNGPFDRMPYLTKSLNIQYRCFQPKCRETPKLEVEFHCFYPKVGKRYCIDQGNTGFRGCRLFFYTVGGQQRFSFTAYYQARTALSLKTHRPPTRKPDPLNVT